MTNRYTKKKIKFISTGYTRMGIPALTRVFNKKFKLNKTEVSIKAALTSRKITCGRTTGNLNNGRSRMFTPAQVKFIKTKYSLFSQIDLTARFNKRFGAEITEQQIRSFTRNHKIRSGRSGRFEKGHPSWNKNTKGLTSANVTSFKKGHNSWPQYEIGTERIDNKDGYIHIKIAETNPYTGGPTRYKPKHIVIWEREHGPVPQGMVVVFVNGDKLNCVIENLMLVSRAELLHLNQSHYKDLPAELKPEQLALTKLETRISSLMKNNTGIQPAQAGL